MFHFDPAEKKFLFQCDKEGIDLMNLSDVFWQKIVEQCNGEILSSMKSERCHAHVLSASSLFVWEKKGLLITCGTTALIRAVEILIQELPITAASFIRRQAKYPHLQLTTTADDIHLLRSRHQFKEQHFPSFTAKAAVLNASQLSNSTVLLMWGCSGEGHQLGLNGAVELLLEKLNTLPYMSEFALSSHAFSPNGFSCNGIAKNGTPHYFALHQSPQANVNYLSVETDFPHADELFKSIKDLFKPQRIEEGKEVYQNRHKMVYQQTEHTNESQIHLIQR